MAQFPQIGLATPAVFWQDIDEQVLGAPAAAITFSGIDPSFTFLRATPYIIKDGTTGSVFFTLNNDGGANYDWQRISANAAVVNAVRSVGDVRINLTVIENIAASREFNGEVLVVKPLAAEEAQVISLRGWEGQTPNAVVLEMSGAQWNNNTALVSQMDFTPSATSFDTGTRVLLEGGKPA